LREEVLGWFVESEKEFDEGVFFRLEEEVLDEVDLLEGMFEGEVFFMFF
jgi:hypothetical protein